VNEIAHHDAHLADDGFHEIQLSGKQLVFLFMATTVVAVLIFLCGVQVGRNVKAPDRLADAADPLASTAAAPASAAPSQPVASSGPPASEPPAPAQEPDDELSYAKRLQAETPPAEKLKQPSAPPPSSAATTAAKTATQPAAAPPTAEPPANAAKATAKPQVPATAASAGRPGTWIVQLTALRDRTAAATIAHRLAGRGYPAFVLDPAPGSPPMYRVQVGGYPDRAVAEQAARRLEKEEQFKTYVRSR
jgi:cell division septation protein DedD